MDDDWFRVSLTLALGCKPATSSTQAFQHASSNDIHSHNELFISGSLNDVNRMQELQRNLAYFLQFSFIVEFTNWLPFEVSLMLALNITKKT